MFGILRTLIKRLLLCGPFGTRWLWSMNGEPTSLWLPSPSNVYYGSLTLVNRLSISFGTTSKPEEHGCGRLSSCTSFVGLRWVTMISFHWEQAFLGERTPKHFVKKIKFWMCGITLWLNQSKCNKRVFNKNNGMNPRLNTLFGITSLCMPMQFGLGLLNSL